MKRSANARSVYRGNSKRKWSWMRREEGLADARLARSIYARPRSGSRATYSSRTWSPSSSLSVHNNHSSGKIIIDTTVSMEAEAEAWAALELQPQPAPSTCWELESSPLQLTYEEEWSLFGMGHSSDGTTADTTAYEDDSSWPIDTIWNFHPTTIATTSTTTEAAAAAINSKN